MKKIKELLNRPWFVAIAATWGAVLLYVLLNHISSVKSAFDSVMDLFSTVIIGAVVAYLFDPAAKFFERKVFKKVKKEGSARAFSVTLVAVIVVLALVLLLVALVPSVAKSVSNLVANWDSYKAKLEDLLNWASNFAEEHNINFDLTNINEMISTGTTKLFEIVKDNSKTILSVAGSVGTSVSNFVIGVLFGFCFLYAKKGILTVINTLRAAVYKEKRIERNNEILSHCHTVFIEYVESTLFDALIIGVATLIFMVIFGMSYAPLIAVICALMNIIPTFGPMIGTGVGIFFLVLDKPLDALVFFIFECVLQSIDGLVIKPKLFKGSLGIPAVWSLVLIILGGKIAGMAGIILCVPFGAILVIIYNETIKPHLTKRIEKINGREKAAADETKSE